MADNSRREHRQDDSDAGAEFSFQSPLISPGLSGCVVRSLPDHLQFSLRLSQPQPSGPGVVRLISPRLVGPVVRSPPNHVPHLPQPRPSGPGLVRYVPYPHLHRRRIGMPDHAKTTAKMTIDPQITAQMTLAPQTTNDDETRISIVPFTFTKQMEKNLEIVINQELNDYEGEETVEDASEAADIDADEDHHADAGAKKELAYGDDEGEDDLPEPKIGMAPQYDRIDELCPSEAPFCKVCLKENHYTSMCPFLNYIPNPRDVTLGEGWMIACTCCGRAGHMRDPHPGLIWEGRAIRDPRTLLY